MADLETTPTPRPDYAPAPGLGLGYVHLGLPRDPADVRCQFCGQPIGASAWAWAEAVSDGRGGLCFTAPICGECQARKRAA